MADQGGCPLSELLPESFDQMPQALLDATSPELGRNQGRMVSGFVGDVASHELRNALNMDVFEMVAHGWCVAKELYEYTDKTKHPAGETAVVHLGEHAFVKVLHPVMDIWMGSVQCGSLHFTLELAAHFRAMALSIKDGFITEAGAGDGFVSATLKYHDVPLHSKQSRPVSFPAHITFKAPGLAIASTHAEAAA